MVAQSDTLRRQHLQRLGVDQEVEPQKAQKAQKAQKSTSDPIWIVRAFECLVFFCAFCAFCAFCGLTVAKSFAGALARRGVVDPDFGAVHEHTLNTGGG